jgi:uncharacterized protein YjiS (DUF1127 family)
MIALPRNFSTMSRFAPTQPVGDGILATLALWAERRRQRRALLELDAALLRDIGLSGADAWHESSKPFWRA